jgi:hypothetical protein
MLTLGGNIVTVRPPSPTPCKSWETYFFNPTNLTINTGDHMRWTNSTDRHRHA